MFTIFTIEEVRAGVQDNSNTLSLLTIHCIQNWTK